MRDAVAKRVEMEEEQGEWYPSKPFAPPKDYSNAGLFLNNFYIPEEVLTLILSYLDVQDLLKVSLVQDMVSNNQNI